MMERGYATRSGAGGAREGVCSGAVPVGGPAWVGESDVGAMSADGRAAHYLAACEGAGVDPGEGPFLTVRVGGRVALCAARGVVERLAAMHGIAHELVEAPHAVILCGATLVKVVSRATAPDGRSETVTATVPWAHPTRSLALCVARARARATLSLLGVAALDESELEAIPGALTRRATPVDLAAVARQRASRDATKTKPTRRAADTARRDS